MRQRTLTIRVWIASLACLAVMVSAWAASRPRSKTGGGAPRQLAAAPADADPTAKKEPHGTWAKALAHVRAGRFQLAIGQFQSHLKVTPKDPPAEAALRILRDHRSRQTQVEAERKTELAEAARRVRQALLSQAFQPKLVKAKLDTKLRKQVQDAIAPYNTAGNSESLEESDDKGGKDLQKRTIKAYADSRSAVKKALKVLEGSDGEYARTFRKLTATYLARLKAQEKIWSSIDPSTAEGRRAAVRGLHAGEGDLTAALGDLETMIAKKPWRIGLMHARLAKQIAVPKDRMTEQEWYRRLIARIEARGKKSVADAEWYDALAVFAGLYELDRYNPYYYRMLKTVRRHVRVLNLYGQNGHVQDANDNGDDKPKPSSKPASGDDEPGWKDIVSRVDVDMVEKAIEQLDGYYVTSVDYRKVARGGLKSVKVLAETPQASHSFPALADKAKRARFIKTIDRQLETIQKRDRVDHLDLQLALNSILRASERSVQIPTEVLAVEFTDGFLDELDKFSSMIWPNDVDDFRKQTMGHFYGVGIQITKEPGEPLKVVTPLADSPAFRAGIKTNDLIVAVDGKRTEGLSIDKLVRRITGPKGTKVMLRIKRLGKVKPFDVPIIREEIRIRTVKGWRRHPSGEWNYLIDAKRKIGYVRITQFTDQTAKHMADALTELIAAGARSLIVDLRYNPGGLLRAATNVANEFLSAGRIVSTRGLQTRQTEINARAAGKYLNGDVIFLVNRHSASAAEIVAGAVQDRQRGLIVGERTFGKGSVQNVIPIRKHRAFLKLTTAYYYLPLGRCLHRIDGAKSWGVDPDVQMRITPRQARRWLEIRRKTDLLREVDPAELTRDLAAQYRADIQLNAAMLLLKLMQLDHANAKTGKQAA